MIGKVLGNRYEIIEKIGMEKIKTIKGVGYKFEI